LRVILLTDGVEDGAVNMSEVATEGSLVVVWLVHDMLLLHRMKWIVVPFREGGEDLRGGVEGTEVAEAAEENP
jgi:hypothetical protein